MVKNVLLIQPFSVINKQLDHLLLAWPLYLENFLKAYFNNLKFDILYLPADQKEKRLNIRSYNKDQIKKLYAQMNHLVSALEFEIDESTLILISCSFSHFYLPTKKIAEYFNSVYKTTPIVVGGAHISACKNAFKEDSSIDYLVPGEGEIPLYNLIKNQNPKKNKKPKILKKEFIYNLNDLPPLDFSSLSIEKYIDNFSELAIYLSRGCPFNCNFCMEKNLIADHIKVKKWRSYSPSRAVEELLSMIKFGEDKGILNFGFLDPIFGFDQKWLKSFLEKYTPLNSCSFWLETRLDILNEKILRKFKKNKFIPWYGLEHTSHKMLKIMNKTKNPIKFLDKFQKILNIHNHLNFLCQINVLLLHPGETRETLTQAFDDLENMIINHDFDKILLSIRRFHNYPGTFIFNNPEFLQKKYGAQIYHVAMDWWKEEDLNAQRNGEYCVRPSSDLSLRDGVKIWTKYYKNFNKLEYEKRKSIYKQEFGSIQMALRLKAQNKILENRTRDFIGFLNQQEIEMD